jgi:3-methylfumaryl-CoA hydratase
MMEPSQLDIEYLRQWIGRTEQASDVVTARLVRGLLATISENSPEPVDGMEAPLAAHWCLATHTVPMSGLGPDGHPAGGGALPPVSLPRRMWAGGRLEFHDRLRVSDTVTRQSAIRDVSAKQGRTGTLCFVTVDHEISTARGLAIKERQDIVYRDVDTAKSASPTGTPAPLQPSSNPRTAKWSRTVPADAVLLFRYSALTFNGHRIHYDRSYCVDVEGYPGLIVHGPLQATMLLEFAVALKEERTPTSFDFRSVSPLFDGAPFTLNADEEGDDLRLWTANAEGQVAMEAKAAW